MVTMTVSKLAVAIICLVALLSSLSHCMNYLKMGGVLPPGCCSGVKSLNGMAKTPLDRKQECTCLKSVSGSIKGINYGLAAGLPGKCGISIPYKISPGTDCSK